MNKAQILIFTVVILSLYASSFAEPIDYWRCASPTDGFWGLNEKLAPSGIEMGFGINNIYQVNTRGGTSTNNRKGRFTGSYDLEISADLRKLLGWDHGSVFLNLEGGWPEAEGIDSSSIGSAFGVNADAIGNDNIIIKQLFYEGPLFNEAFTITFGKIDFTGIFDRNAYADDECSQFLNAAFVDNLTIPFPAYSLGVAINWDITDSWYLLGGVADAQADGRETGINTTFHDEDYFFYALETGKTVEIDSAKGPMPGTYRIGLWNDPQPKANSDETDSSHDDVGFYTSCDQMLYKENSDKLDSQGLGAFFRYGYAPSRRNDITNFFSAGLHYQGLLNSRDDDVLGVGFAHGIFADSAATTYPQDYESAWEIYYNAQITPWFHLSPGIQYISNPGGSSSTKDAVVFGLRAHVTF